MAAGNPNFVLSIDYWEVPSICSRLEFQCWARRWALPFPSPSQASRRARLWYIAPHRWSLGVLKVESSFLWLHLTVRFQRKHACWLATTRAGTTTNAHACLQGNARLVGSDRRNSGALPLNYAGQIPQTNKPVTSLGMGSSAPNLPYQQTYCR